MSKLVIGRHLRRPLGTTLLRFWISSRRGNRARISVDDAVHHDTQLLERRLTGRRFGLVCELLLISRRQRFVWTGFISHGQEVIRRRSLLDITLVLRSLDQWFNCLLRRRLERQITDRVVEISERVVFAFEWRPLTRRLARLDRLDRSSRVVEGRRVELFVLC